jgi:hypothetical protein
MAHWRVINQLGQKEAETDQTIRPLTTPKSGAA